MKCSASRRCSETLWNVVDYCWYVFGTLLIRSHCLLITFVPLLKQEWKQSWSWKLAFMCKTGGVHIQHRAHLHPWSFVSRSVPAAKTFSARSYSYYYGKCIFANQLMQMLLVKNEHSCQCLHMCEILTNCHPVPAIKGYCTQIGEACLKLRKQWSCTRV